MRKILPFILPGVFAITLQAQPTIRQSDLPVAGDQWVTYSDNREGAHQLPSLGANQNWDYSKSFMVSDTGVSKFVTPGSVPAFLGPGSFPNANLAIFSIADSSASYFLKNSTGLYVDGVYLATNDAFGKIDYSPDALIIPVPFTYNDSRNSNSRFVILTKFDTLNARLTFNATINFTAPGHGNLKTPAGSFSNTLLIRRRTESLDSFYIDFLGTGNYFLFNASRDTTIEFLWARSGNTKLELMSITADATGTISQGAGYSDFTATAVVEPERTVSVTEVYPNPAESGSIIQFVLTEESAHEISIMDADGKVVRKDVIEGYRKVGLSSRGMSPGLYFYQVSDRQGKMLDSGKFVIQ